MTSVLLLVRGERGWLTLYQRFHILRDSTVRVPRAAPLYLPLLGYSLKDLTD